MGRSASAYLIYGLDFGSEEDHWDDDYVHGFPPWLVELVPESEREDSYTLGRAIEKHFEARSQGWGLKVITYGYEFGSRAWGIEIASAIDYGSERVKPERLGPEIRNWFDQLIADLNMPPDFVSDYHLLAEYA